MLTMTINKYYKEMIGIHKTIREIEHQRMDLFGLPPLEEEQKEMQDLKIIDSNSFIEKIIHLFKHTWQHMEIGNLSRQHGVENIIICRKCKIRQIKINSKWKTT